MKLLPWDKVEMNFLPQAKRWAAELKHDLNLKLEGHPYVLKCATEFGKISENAGDAIGPFLDCAIRARKNPPLLCTYRNQLRLPNILTVGSILRFADRRSIVWGSGFNLDTDTFGNLSWRGTRSSSVLPRQILAVRGPLTRDRCFQLGCKNIDVLGDPGMILPVYLPCTSKVKSYRLGVILHKIDMSSKILRKCATDSEMLCIPAMQPLEDFVAAIMQCDAVVSSSLHGLILADAYGIPNRWIRPADGTSLDYRFKFHDYFLSVRRAVQSPLIVCDIKELRHEVVVPYWQPPDLSQCSALIKCYQELQFN